MRSRKNPPTTAGFGEGSRDRLVGAGSEDGVGVKEEECVSSGFAGAEVHLARAALLAGDDAGARTPGDCNGPIDAASVRDHDLRALGERAESRGEVRGLVPRRNHHAQRHGLRC